MASVLSVEGITKTFGELRALDNISLNVEDKSVTILIGPNGSGKTTLINVISGIYRPDQGKIIFAKKDITRLPPHKVYRLGIARTFQIPTLFLKLTVLENMLVAEKDNPGESFFRALNKGSWKKAEEQTIKKAGTILSLVGLSKIWDSPSSKISGGQMKLLEVGRALMSGARLILLDEPVSGVNPTLAHEIFVRLLDLRDRLGITFFLVEHRLDIAMSYVDEVVAMAYGRLLASGKPREVLNDRAVIDSYLGG